MSVDPYIVGTLSITGVLALCLGILFTMRDRNSASPRVVTRSVWCAARRQEASVELLERTVTGITIRGVQRCSLRAVHERCGERCRYPEAIDGGVLRMANPCPARH